MKKMIASACCFILFSACENVDTKKHSTSTDNSNQNRPVYNGNPNQPNSQNIPNYQNSPNYQSNRNVPNGNYPMQDVNRTAREPSRSVQDGRPIQNNMRNSSQNQ